MIVECLPTQSYASFPRPDSFFRESVGWYWPPYGMTYGVGDLAQQGSARPSKEQIIVSTPVIVGSTIQTAAALGSKWAAAAMPIVGPAVVAVTVGLSLLFARKGPKQKVATTEIVNRIEPELKKNLEGYFSGPRTRSSQAQALANFDAAWQYLVEHCGSREMGEPGKRCIRDRQAGSCTWRASCSKTVDGVCVDWVPDPAGECWNWFVAYRDPIEKDPGVRPDPDETFGLPDVGWISDGGGRTGSGTGRLVPLVAAVVILYVGLEVLRK